MKLYYTPGVCSLSPHIVLIEAGYSFDLVRVDLAKKVTEDGRALRSIHSKNYVPLLELDDGEVLTEGPAILQYLADGRPEAGLIPAPGTRDRYRAVEWLNYISTELHKTFYPLFHLSIAGTTWPKWAVEKLGHQFVMLNDQFSGQYTMNNAFSVVDAYLFTVLSWTRAAKVDLTPYPRLIAFMARVIARPSVQRAFAAEGLDGTPWVRAAA